MRIAALSTAIVMIFSTSACAASAARDCFSIKEIEIDSTDGKEYKINRINDFKPGARVGLDKNNMLVSC